MNIETLTLKELATLIAGKLEAEGVDAVLVGGACVTIYSKNRYQSYDLDFVTHTELKRIDPVLEPLGFTREGRVYSHPRCPYLLDFVYPPVAIGGEPVREYSSLTSEGGALKLLTPTDCVKDRLAAFFHWGDTQSLEQAALVASSQSINIGEVKRWAEAKGWGSGFPSLKRQYRGRAHTDLSDGFLLLGELRSI